MDLSATEVAVIAGALFGAAGTAAGGVYVELKLGEALGASEPQAGAQLTPPAVSVQITPEFVLSFDTAALTETAGPPAIWFANLLVMTTLTGSVGWGFPPLAGGWVTRAAQPASWKAIKSNEKDDKTRVIALQASIGELPGGREPRVGLQNSTVRMLQARDGSANVRLLTGQNIGNRLRALAFLCKTETVCAKHRNSSQEPVQGPRNL